jgi:homoserine/homoserine lactone efflux protein
LIDPEKLATFALVSAAASLVPGPSMLFVMGQSVWRGARSGALALGGIQFGYVWWWVLAAFGLGTLALTFPIALHLLAFAGACYLIWLGIGALRSAGGSHDAPKRSAKLSSHAFRQGFLVAISNPKSLIYMAPSYRPLWMRAVQSYRSWCCSRWSQWQSMWRSALLTSLPGTVLHEQ